ncbi:shikimate kinase [Paenibacillus cellulosilyticus]|uniref:Shikimate kinase n=1 Tax=Paenibacillus cellulosilyticus TaxID=375489 RepID=A0A2V2YWP4_9BACL|nr:shikimate kinase [Paenibacillus cellulosilyticus]PWW06152.1 shikimate kinase [Paenibacillus cellulosilyticus]QKS43079.1 shikimate kinase [Paenibacillus cellulosilyticus]
MSGQPNPHKVAAGTGTTNKIVLVGFMGTGKSTVSRLLAERLGWQRIDSDEEIERRSGKKISELFAEGGEDYFRDVETTTLQALMTLEQPAVIATGGGAVLRETNRTCMLDNAFVVALKADEAHIIARVGNDPSRPLLQGDAAANVRRLLDARRTAYDFATLSVDTTGLSPEDVCSAIIEQWTAQFT